MPDNALGHVYTAFSEGLRPEPDVQVSDWAEDKRILSSRETGEPGPWRNSRTPYLREVMDCLSPKHPAQHIVFMAGAQVAKTEAGINWTGCVVEHAPGPMMAVYPTVEMGKRWSRQRLDSLIETTPSVRAKVRTSRSRYKSNTILSKEFDGGILVVTGANSPTGLRSMPVRYLFLDEVDGYPLDVGEEGDPLDLAIERTVTFYRRKIFICSTPKIKGESRIEDWYERSDKRRYFVACKHCDERSTMEWKDIRWPEDEPEKATWHCPKCGGEHEESDKLALLVGGEWQATAVSRTGVVGFHLSQLYSPFKPWSEIAISFVEARGDPIKLKTFVNMRLAQTWAEPTIDNLDVDHLLGRREPDDDWTISLPPEVVALTVGVDVQDDRLELELVGWGRDEESWSIDYRVIPGDPADREVWRALDRYLLRRWEHPLRRRGLPIRAACIDANYESDAVYKFTDSRRARNVWAILGRGGVGKPPWPVRRTKRSSVARYFFVGVDTIKESVVGRLKLPPPGPGTMHFPANRDPEYFRQLTAEHRVKKWHRGRQQVKWTVRPGRRNEALDCRVYAYAALCGLIATGTFRLNELADEIDRLAAIGGEGPPADDKPTISELLA